jgi:hypothetical protein
MDITLLTEDKDPMGSAVYDYFKQGKAARLRVFSSHLPVSGRSKFISESEKSQPLSF